ncbi:hypothetical protein CH63R_09379 [Colletotrichum higginsianum IMI 349063]|uniref:Uncharacterized protein n=2 Tax=Colletotrichum higginsianum (strain IMI 349063) TaxID=759273 RepID=A0A1B7Y7H2_COLHI|nr:hypothetical protein CH63R_09379 [Colletotrichum higginsianum IMI 349063]OBR07858.1 hypothetical protein CH63R_09379 [Colletotrichum higginsianum IMI 349063]
MVAKFEGVGDTPEKSNEMAGREDHDLIASSPIVDKGKGKSSFKESTDITAASLPTSLISQPDEKHSVKDDTDLEFLKMQEFFKGEPLARCLDDYIPPTHIDKEVKVLPLEEDGGESMVKAAKIELWNKLASLTNALEERYPSVKEEREAKQAVVATASAYLDEALGQSSRQKYHQQEAQASTKASRRAEKKAQKKADKKSQKAAKRENPVISSANTQEDSAKEFVLRQRYPEIYAKIDHWRALAGPDMQDDADDDSVSESGIESFQSNTQSSTQPTAQTAAQPATQQTKSIPIQQPSTLASKLDNDKTLADDSSEGVNWSTGSSDGDPFYLNKYLTPSYQAAAKTFLEDFDRKNPVQPVALQPVSQSVANPTVHKAAPQTIDGEDSCTFIQRDPKEKGVRAALHVSDDELSDSEEASKSKAAETQKHKDEINQRAVERVNAAHAEGKIVHLENTKTLREAIVTNIKKEDIVPGFGKTKKQPSIDFDEDAYAERSIASHTMKPAPLRIPSRMKQPVDGGNKKVDAKPIATTLPMVTRDVMVLGVDCGKRSRIVSGSSAHNTRGAVNFSWPKIQRAGGRNKYEFRDDEESDYEHDEKKSDALAAHRTAGTFGKNPVAGDHDSTTSAANQPKGSAQSQSSASAQPDMENSQDTQRRSFTADEYQALIQDEFDTFAEASPEKKQERLEADMAALNTGITDTASSITRQTVVIPAHHRRPTFRLPGTTALPPTPATSHAPVTTGEKLADLDDFFSEENDRLYTTARTNTGSGYGSSYGTSTGTVTGSRGQDEAWNDPNYHEDALAYGYAYKQTNYHTLPDSMNPVPLTQDQRRQVLTSYGMSEAEYPAPPAGYPNPPGPDKGSNVPPCPTRPAPSAPAPSSAGGGGDGLDKGGSGRYCIDGEAPAESLRKHRRFQRAATAPPAPPPVSPAPGYDADWF